MIHSEGAARTAYPFRPETRRHEARAQRHCEDAEARRENLAQAGKLSRTFAMLLEVLNRHRGKGQQPMVVEHVHPRR
jgi:hypothetical protein